MNRILKVLIISIPLLLNSFVIFSQARVGSSASDIKEEYAESRYNLKDGYDKDNDYYIKITTVDATVYYYFNADKICTITEIIPDNQGSLNSFVEIYNKRYVIISSTQWKMYSKNGIANIELIYPKSGGYFFLWTNN